MIRKEIIGVYGTGTIGSGQATLTTGNGYAVVVVGHSARGISRCKRAIEHNWDDLIAEGLASEENKAAAMNLHIKVLTPGNNHHMMEAMFKAFAKALDMAVGMDSRITDVLSTKGSL